MVMVVRLVNVYVKLQVASLAVQCSVPQPASAALYVGARTERAARRTIAGLLASLVME
jgi:hypothetical protein